MPQTTDSLIPAPEISPNLTQSLCSSVFPLIPLPPSKSWAPPNYSKSHWKNGTFWFIAKNYMKRAPATSLMFMWRLWGLTDSVEMEHLVALFCSGAAKKLSEHNFQWTFSKTPGNFQAPTQITKSC